MPHATAEPSRRFGLFETRPPCLPQVCGGPAIHRGGSHPAGDDGRCGRQLVRRWTRWKVRLGRHTMPWPAWLQLPWPAGHVAAAWPAAAYSGACTFAAGGHASVSRMMMQFCRCHRPACCAMRLALAHPAATLPLRVAGTCWCKATMRGGCKGPSTRYKTPTTHGSWRCR